MVDAQLFRQWWDVFHSTDSVVEIRLIGNKAGRGSVPSAYFTNCETALAAVQGVGEGISIYSPFNQIKEACANRKQLGQFLQEKTTVDDDIEQRRWIMIDFDPARPSDTNSSDEERKCAYQLMLRVGTYLRDQGFHSPVVVMSGNGYHLYYRIEAPANEETKNICSDFLKALDMMFSVDECKIDTSVFNAARITKVVGSMSYKGRNTDDRPCRMATFVKVPDHIEITSFSYVKKVAGELPQKETPNRFNGYRTDFDIDSFISDHHIEVAYERKDAQWRKIVLKQCPFNPSHQSPDSAIFISPSGAIGFKCLHNSCSHFTWKDVRLHFDPNAYSQRDQAEYKRRRDYYSSSPKPAPIIIEESNEIGKKWQSMRDIEWQDPSKLIYIPTGVNEIDKRIGGLCLGDVTLLTGLAGAGKTSLLNTFILTAIQHGYKAAVWSGELSGSRFKSWINQAAAGHTFVQKGVGDVDYYYCPRDIAEKIDAWTDGKLFLYNNNYGNKVNQLLEDIKQCVKENGTQLILCDNLMSMSLDSLDGDKNERQAWLINQLKDLAIQAQIHVLLVAHPRKEIMNTLLRMESISGSSDLYNAAANVLLCHRVGRDFERRARDFFGKEYVDEIIAQEYNEVIEVAKNRSHGTKDFIAGLFYEYQTRRFLNTPGEHIPYGWQDMDDSLPEPPQRELGEDDVAPWENDNDEDMPEGL